MKDTFGREIDYMRISITDRCNLRCRYCMPEGIEWIPMKEILTFEEIKEAAEEAAALGICKLKVTGGEPLVRRGCPDLIRMLKEIPGIKEVTLTTNGVLLSEYMPMLKEAGLTAVNVSLDTLDPKRYAEITGKNELDRVMAGIEAALAYDMPLKLNAVLRSEEDGDWEALSELTNRLPLDVRFIELMPIGMGEKLKPISNEVILEKLLQKYPKLKRDDRKHGNGPAVYYHIPGALGSVGFISAIHGRFCESCNRIRMTSTGDIKGCLCYDEGISIKEALRSGDRKVVRTLLTKAIQNKPQGHCFDQKGSITEHRKMSRIGG